MAWTDQLAQTPAYSYRNDTRVPAFPDDKPLIVFDGVCVLCEGFARFVVRHDMRGAFRLTQAQSGLGQALYRHYGLDTRDFETNLLVVGGRAYGKSDAFFGIMRVLSWPWRLANCLRLLPRPLRDWLYDRLARNRYRIFGQHDACMMPPPDWRERYIA